MCGALVQPSSPYSLLSLMLSCALRDDFRRSCNEVLGQVNARQVEVGSLPPKSAPIEVKVRELESSNASLTAQL